MSQTKTLITASKRTTDTPRARRGAAAVVAKYIQDLTQDLTEPTSASAAAA